MDSKTHAVLSAIVHATEGFTGSDIVEATGRRPQTVRYILHRLWASGWITGGVDASGNLPCFDERFYRVTDLGHREICALLLGVPRSGRAADKGDA